MSAPGVASSEEMLVGIVSSADDASHSERHPRLVAAVRAAGAVPEIWTEAVAISKGGAVDAVLFDLGATPERFVPVAASLESEPRTRGVPRILVVDDRLGAARLTSFGACSVVLASAPPEALTSAIERALSRVRAESEILRLARTSSSDLRDLEQAVGTLQREGAALSHDARVLFGVILGFAANLRDGFAGPVTEEQHQHLVNIVEAAGDAMSLLERYDGVLRRAAPSVPGTSSSAPRVATRRHVDLGELVRATVALFDGIAVTKRIRLEADADRTAYAWCDPMQMKQAVVNLVSNALKFTPDGGTIRVVVRLGPLGPSRGEATDRRDVEITVSDTGPGVPEQERERIFERGVRLTRDEAMPGTGQGLAIVRDIAEMHGGTARAGQAPEGGASISLIVPTDWRERKEPPAANGASSQSSRSEPPPPAIEAGRT